MPPHIFFYGLTLTLYHAIFILEGSHIPVIFIGPKLHSNLRTGEFSIYRKNMLVQSPQNVKSVILFK